MSMGIRVDTYAAADYAVGRSTNSRERLAIVGVPAWRMTIVSLLNARIAQIADR